MDMERSIPVFFRTRTFRSGADLPRVPLAYLSEGSVDSSHEHFLRSKSQGVENTNRSLTL